MAAFSLDLRQRILTAALAGDDTEQAVADRFGVSRGFVQKLKRRWRHDGTAEPIGHRGGASPKLSGDDRAALAAWVEAEPDATGAELAGNSSYPDSFSGFNLADEPRHQETYPDSSQCTVRGPRFDPNYNWHDNVTTWTEYYKGAFPSKLSHVDLVSPSFAALGWPEFSPYAKFLTYADGTEQYSGYYASGCTSCLDVVEHQNYLWYWLDPSRHSDPPHFLPLDLRYFNNIRFHRDRAGARPAWGVVDVTLWGNRTPGNEQYSYFLNEGFIRLQANSYIAHGYKGYTMWEYANPARSALAHYYTGTVYSSHYNPVKEFVLFTRDVVGPMVMHSEFVGAYHTGDFLDYAGTIIEEIPSAHLVTAAPAIASLVALDGISSPNILVGLFQRYTDPDGGAGLPVEETYYYVVNRGFASGAGQDPSRSVSLSIPGDHRGNVAIADQASGTYQSATVTYQGGVTTVPINNLMVGEGRLVRVTDGPFTIVGNRTFGSEFNGYVFDRSVYVAPGATLTIDDGADISFINGLLVEEGGQLNADGVTLRFGPGEHLTIYGGLNAAGTTFTASDVSSGWSGIRFESGSSGSLSEGISQLTIVSEVNGWNASIYVNGSEVDLDGTHLIGRQNINDVDPRVDGIYVTGSKGLVGVYNSIIESHT